MVRGIPRPAVPMSHQRMVGEDPDAHKNVYGIPGEIGDNLFGRVVPEPIAEEQIMEGFLFAAEGELSVGDNVTQEVVEV